MEIRTRNSNRGSNLVGPRNRIVLFCALAAACSGSSEGRYANTNGVAARMDFRRAESFFSAPFPSDDLRHQDRIELSSFPNPRDVSIVRQSISLLERDAHGFATSGAVFFSFNSPLDGAGLPDPAASIQAGAPVFLIGVDPDAPDYLRRYPVEVAFREDGGTFGAPNLLSLLPVQGVPLRPGTRYAAVVRRDLSDREGGTLAQPAELRDLLAGRSPAGLSAEAFAAYRQALGALGEAGISASEIAGLAVFTTGEPTRQLGVLREDVLARPRPQLSTPWKLSETFAEYCVYEATIPMPVYQQGIPPYTSSGGDWAFDTLGRPVLQHSEEATLFATVPRRSMPSAGFPTVVFIRIGGGGDRPIVDRGRTEVAGDPPVVAGSGPALQFARAGYAGVSIDGPLGGRRNPLGLDENAILWNVTNGAALRDNIRQQALETILTAHILDTLTLDTSTCPGAPATTRFDTQQLALMGHSNGATIAPIAMAYEPRFRAAILSGAGASWIENIVYKRKPLPVREVAELMLGYPLGTLHVHDPVLTLVQWAAEPADPQVYNRLILGEPATGGPRRHVLMFQGIVDNYILPRIANATSLSLGLDLGGEALDARAVPELADQTPVETLLPLVGRQQIALPARGNGPGGSTAVVVQHLGDGIEDGHEVVFQRDAPKYQYRCFLESLARGGSPIVPAPAALDAACPN